MHCITFQIRFYIPKFVIKILNPTFLTPTVLPFPKIRCKGKHRAIHSSTPQPFLENLANNLAKKLFKKWSDLPFSRKLNNHLKTIYIMLKSLHD